MEDGVKRSTKLHKSVQHYLRKKLKKIPPISIPSSTIPVSIASRRLLSTCRFPRTPSFDGDDPTATAGYNGRDHAATLSDVDRFLFDNFRSLYIHDRDDNATSRPNDEETSSSSEASLGDGRGGGGVAVVVFSVDPYADFRRSLQGMMAMHHGEGCEAEALDWDFMEELLFYYLQLNDQGVHKHILRAFADLAAAGTPVGNGSGKPHWADKSVRSKKH